MSDNWALKASNIRKLLRNLTTYLNEGLGKEANLNVDINGIARDQKTEDIALLIEIIAAAAVTCPDKQKYVQRIMSLSPDSQNTMKEVLQTGLGRLSDFQVDDSENVEDDELVFEEESGLFQNNDFEEQLEDARREVASLKSQLEIAEEEHTKSQEKLKAIVEDLQDRIVQRQDELIQTEEDLKRITASYDDVKAKCTQLETEKAQLEDDLDVASAKAQQLVKAEATAMAYKKRLEDMGQKNQQMTDLEEQTSKYVRQIMELEAEQKKIPGLQKTIAELQEKLSILEREKLTSDDSSKNIVNELATVRTQLAEAESAKKMFQDELTELRAHQETHNEINQSLDAEKLARLESENDQLRKDLEAAKSSTPQVVASVPDAEVEKLQKEIENLRLNAAPDRSAEVEALRKELEERKAENAKISSDKDKLEAYTKRTLAKFQDKYLVALQECKAKLKEKQDKIESLESRSANERSAQKREERLLSSVIYELGLGIMHNKLKEK